LLTGQGAFTADPLVPRAIHVAFPAQRSRACPHFEHQHLGGCRDAGRLRHLHWARTG
jgi:hypothetical protein